MSLAESPSETDTERLRREDWDGSWESDVLLPCASASCRSARKTVNTAVPTIHITMTDCPTHRAPGSDGAASGSPESASASRPGRRRSRRGRPGPTARRCPRQWTRSASVARRSGSASETGAEGRRGPCRTSCVGSAGSRASAAGSLSPGGGPSTVTAPTLPGPTPRPPSQPPAAGLAAAVAAGAAAVPAASGSRRGACLPGTPARSPALGAAHQDWEFGCVAAGQWLSASGRRRRHGDWSFAGCWAACPRSSRRVRAPRGRRSAGSSGLGTGGGRRWATRGEERGGCWTSLEPVLAKHSLISSRALTMLSVPRDGDSRCKPAFNVAAAWRDMDGRLVEEVDEGLSPFETLDGSPSGDMMCGAVLCGSGTGEWSLRTASSGCDLAGQILGIKEETEVLSSGASLEDAAGNGRWSQQAASRATTRKLQTDHGTVVASCRLTPDGRATDKAILIGAARARGETMQCSSASNERMRDASGAAVGCRRLVSRLSQIGFLGWHGCFVRRISNGFWASPSHHLRKSGVLGPKSH